MLGSRAIAVHNTKQIVDLYEGLPKLTEYLRMKRVLCRPLLQKDKTQGWSCGWITRR